MPSNEGAERPSRASLRRPNGRPQACEPCRKRKVACDNRQPVCRRCEKAARSTTCQYIVDPRMSIAVEPFVPKTPFLRRRELPSLSSRVVEPIPPAPRIVHPTEIPSSPSSSHASSSRHQSAAPRQPSPNSSFSPVSDTPLSNPVTGPGYLGPTSFCGIYEEAEERLSLLQEICETARSDPDTFIPTSSLPDLSPRTLETCLVVLRQIPVRKEAERLCSVYTNPNEIWFWLFGNSALASLFDTFGDVLGDERTDAGLGDMAKRLCFNTSHSFPENADDPETWERQFTGVNFRWETLAILFTYFSFGTNVSTPMRYECMRVPKLRSKMNDYLDAIDICVQLCRTLNNGSTFLLFVLFRRTILESMRSGDASPLVWKGQGEVVSHLTFLGLHAESNPPNYAPTLCTEWRRRLCYYVFNIDKVIAAFTGRPPGFSRRYLLTPWPLDIPDKNLKAGKETLAKFAATQLDANGWNKSGIVGPATVCRARAVVSVFRDEIFELAMGNGVGITVDLLWDIFHREKAAIAALPPGLLYKYEDLTNPDVDHNMLAFRLLVHLEHLQNRFFLYRMLKQRGYDIQADLVAVSFELVSLTLLYWTHLDRVPRIVTDLEWLVMAYAAPGGGILSQELLCPTTTPGTTVGGETRPSRFAIIEKLFLLVGFLDWVSPNAPNGDLCRSCKRVIRHVLDKVTSQEPTPAPGLEQAAPAFEPWNWDIGGTSLDFDFELLDTFDWLRPEMHSSQGQLGSGLG